MLSLNVAAQSNFTLNTRAWTTNYWTMVIYNSAQSIVGYFIISDDEDRATYSRIIPSADMVFPVGIEKEGFDANNIYGGYHRAFSNPFKRPGDFGLGLDGSWKPGFLGLYAGAYFKSQELCFKADPRYNLRSMYFQPRAGIIMGQKGAVEAGVYYDMVVGAAGSYPNANKDMFLNGLGLDLSLSYGKKDGDRALISFMLPLHNFLNDGYITGEFNGMHRRVGYIMLTQRISF